MNKRLSLLVVPISFILLLLVGAGIYWFFTKGDGDGTLLKKPLDGDTLKVFRVPGGTLSTSGLTITETLSKSNKSDHFLPLGRAFNHGSMMRSR